MYSHRIRLRRARPRLLLITILLIIITQLINVIAWITDFSSNKEWLSNKVVKIYIAVACIGLLLFIFVSSPLLYMSYAFASEMSPSSRRWATCIAIVITFFTHIFPLTWMQIWLVWKYGWISTLQGVSFVLLLICFAVGFFTTWLSYVWWVSKVLQIRFGEAVVSQHPVMDVQLSYIGQGNKI